MDNTIEQWIGNGSEFCRQINQEKDENHKTEYYSLAGDLLGYKETDAHFRERIKKEIEHQNRLKSQ